MKIRMSDGARRAIKFFCLLLFVLGGLTSSARAQSINQSFPTAITTSEIIGRIAARDIGDARLTNYFYTFNAAQGDVFINVVTANFNGDIDVFTADNLRPLTKITIFADGAGNETGRVIYLRQPTKLILRIEGRTPNDNAATYRIKFAGSFAPAEAATAENADAAEPTVKSDNQTDVRVNSVGTIIEIRPKPTPAPKETVAAAEPAAETKKPVEEKIVTSEIKIAPVASESPTTETEKESPVKNPTEDKTAVVVEAPRAETLEIEKPEPAAPEAAKETVETVAPAKENPAPEEEPKNEIVAETPPAKVEKSKTVKPLPASALENIRLIVLFKDGTKVERPMSDVLKVGVDKGILTIINKNGQIGRYSILDVEKMTIE